MKWTTGLFFLVISTTAQAQTPEEKIAAAGYTLQPVTQPIANYVHVVKTGNLLFLAGKGPALPGGKYVTGQLGKDLTIEQGYEAARITGLAQLAVLKSYLGSLSKVKRIVKVLGLVNAVPEFTDHPKVINGFSDLMVQVFGEKGKHARSAVGASSLPMGMAVEVELVVEVED